MPRIIVTSRYIKPNSHKRFANYVKYIATQLQNLYQQQTDVRDKLRSESETVRRQCEAWHSLINSTNSVSLD